MHDKISVIIPVYNHAHTLARALQSLFVQTVRPEEIIIVNDGSTDNFKKTIEQILCSPEAKGYKIKIIEQINLGAPAARNRGLLEAVGEYVIFWDADTVGRSDMLFRMYAALQENPAASYAYSQFKFGWKKIKSHSFDAALLRKFNYIDATALARRADLPTGGWDETIRRFQDWDLWLTMLADKKTGVFVPECLYTKIVHGRVGISAWLPKHIYKIFSRLKRVREYEMAKKIIAAKHRI